MALQYACSTATTAQMVEDVGCSCDLADLPVSINLLIEAATDALYLLSDGFVSGRCTQTYRPCGSDWCSCGFGETACECIPQGIPLDRLVAPIVTAVKIDGVAFTNWAVIDGYKLVRTDGLSWPGYKNPVLPDTADNTFSITIQSGLAHPFEAQMAAIDLVCEMAAVLMNRAGRLPPGTMQATKDNVSIVASRLPGQAELEATGLSWLARFVGVYGKMQTTTVRSPELSEGWTLHTVQFA